MYGSVGPTDDLSAKAKAKSSLVSFLAGLNNSTGRTFLALTVIYWIAFTSQQLLIKDVVSGSAHFWHKEPMSPYPLFLTGVINGLAASFCISAVIATRFAAKAFPSATTKAWIPNISARQVQIMLIAGCLEGVERGCMNKSFEWLTVATRTDLFSVQIAFTLGVAWTCGLEKVNLVRAVSVGILVIGGVVQGVGMSRMESGTPPMVGIALVGAAMLASSIRWSLIQIVQQISLANAEVKPGQSGQMMTITMISIAKPVDCVFCLCMSFIFESVSWSTFNTEVLKAWWMLALLILCTVLCDYNIVRCVGAVAFGIVANLGNIPMIVGGVVFNDEHLVLSQVMGFSVCTCGALLYYVSRAGLFGKDEEAAPERTNKLPTGKLMEEGSILQRPDQKIGSSKPSKHEG